MASHDDKAPAPKNRLTLAPKHNVFLSHSGAQKGFVEQLDLDLRQCDRYSFFDKDRESLPVGEVFPSLIFESIRQCEVGVVILSNEFFSSKWPMLELVEMVQTMEGNPNGMKILPIFLSVSCADLGDEKKWRDWKAKWHVFVESDDRINICEWERALKVLKSINGLVSNSQVGEVKFREEIVKEICKRVPPFLSWDDSHVQGKLRYTKIIKRKIEETLLSTPYQVQVVGLYGVGGIGKTTTCKFLCNHYNEEFGGRVCHVEFGNGTEMDSLHMILKKLGKASHEHLKELSIDQCRARLKNIMQFGRVFLAIDNVSSNSKVIDEAKRYLGVGYEYGSIVVVTARSLMELENVKIDANDCLPMPEFEEVEAMNLFLYHAAPKDEVDKEILKICINRCYFRKGDDSYHYHPLALEVLGKQLGPSDPRKWALELREEDTRTFNRLRELENPVFSILRRSFDALLLGDKELFMDVAIFHSTRRRTIYGPDYKEVYEDYGLNEKSYWNVFEWLSMVHGLSIHKVKMQLNILKSKSLLEELGDGETIGMHDLWREFALLEIKNVEIEKQLWIYECYEDSSLSGYGKGGGSSKACEDCSISTHIEDEESILCNGGWENLQRISISDFPSFIVEKRISFICSPNAKVLRLNGVNLEEKELVLSGLKHLKILEIFHSLDSSYERVVGIEQLTNLRVLIWFEIDIKTISVVEQIPTLKNLQILVLDFTLFNYGASQRFLFDVGLSLNMGQLRLLRVARIHFKGKFTISGFSSKMARLRVLDLTDCHKLPNCHGVGDMSGLEVLLLSGCKKLETLPNLQKLKNLLVLDITHCESLSEVTGLENLVALQKLKLEACYKLQALPTMSNLTNLHELNVKHCDMLEDIPGMSNLIALQKFSGGDKFLGDSRISGKLNIIKIYGQKGDGFNQEDDGSTEDNFGSSQEGYGSNQDGDRSSLQESRQVLNLAIFESVLALHLEDMDCELTNLTYLTRLEDLSIEHCGLKRLPDMGKDMRLKTFRIFDCRNLRSWDNIGKLELLESNTNMELHCNWTLVHLVELDLCSSVFQLPDLSHFPQLTNLNLHDYCPNRSSISGLALHCHTDHPHLKILRISGWPITDLSDLSKFSSLERLHIFDCLTLTNLTSSKPLRALKKLAIHHCKNFIALPAICHMRGLEDLVITKCGVTLNTHEWQELSTWCHYLQVDELKWSNPKTKRTYW